MSITTTLTAVKDIIKKVDGFTDTNAGVGTYIMLDKGITRAAIILHRLPEHGPGVGQAANQQVGWHHQVTIRLFSKYKDNEANCYSALMTDVASIVDKFDQYPKLDAATGVRRSNITQGTDFFIVPDRDGEGTAFFGIDLILDVWEESKPTALEVA